MPVHSRGLLERAKTQLQGDSRPGAVLIDGSALFLAIRTLYEGLQLNYRALIDLLVADVSGLTQPGPGAVWTMWTSASPTNPGQSRFLDFAEKDLRWEVRRFSPTDSYLVEPGALLGMSTDTRSSRLLRFDASIAFAIGRLAATHRIVVVSDSYSLADPMLRAAVVARPFRGPILAFFGPALDSRWPRVLRKDEQPDAPLFIDLDDSAGKLFGTEQTGRRVTSSIDEHFVF